ncbi:MAG: hypothetical protein JSR82_09070 [Verrucomicrobia bacterium]|nr:hypothetical protein [Verrucomicrobiota bacterium]
MNVSGRAEGRPLIFVHGLRLWGFDMALLARRLREQGREVRYFRYSAHLRGLDANAARLAERLRAAGECDVLAHSLGGVVVHAALRKLGAEAPVRRVAALGVPFRGTRAGDWMHQRGLGFAIGRSVLDWLQGERLDHWPHRAELALFSGNKELGLGSHVMKCLPSPNDGLIALDESRISGAAAHAVIATNHMGLLFSRATAKLAERFLATGSLERS